MATPHTRGVIEIPDKESRAWVGHCRVYPHVGGRQPPSPHYPSTYHPTTLPPTTHTYHWVVHWHWEVGETSAPRRQPLPITEHQTHRFWGIWPDCFGRTRYCTQKMAARSPGVRLMGTLQAGHITRKDCSEIQLIFTDEKLGLGNLRLYHCQDGFGRLRTIDVQSLLALKGAAPRSSLFLDDNGTVSAIILNILGEYAGFSQELQCCGATFSAAILALPGL